ncbi:MAG: CDP-alcohol phosphatidyltransferase family protein [Planctomycetes bacterium]|nr:CDP-alcohol phosphatidyltransferase family protein [Planctomycetota bacterium]
MTTLHWVLTAVTASRWLCTPLWWWLWRKEGAWIIAARVAILAWFGITDATDGRLARTHGLATGWGGWLDHLGDWLFAGSVILLAMAETRAAVRRRGAVTAADGRRSGSTTPSRRRPG